MSCHATHLGWKQKAEYLARQCHLFVPVSVVHCDGASRGRTAKQSLVGLQCWERSGTEVWKGGLGRPQIRSQQPLVWHRICDH